MPGFSNYSTQLTFLHTYSRIIFEIINKPFQPYCVRFYIRCTDTSAISTPHQQAYPQQHVHKEGRRSVCAEMSGTCDVSVSFYPPVFSQLQSCWSCLSKYCLVIRLVGYYLVSKYILNDKTMLTSAGLKLIEDRRIKLIDILQQKFGYSVSRSDTLTDTTLVGVPSTLILGYINQCRQGRHG